MFGGEETLPEWAIFFYNSTFLAFLDCKRGTWGRWRLRQLKYKWGKSVVSSTVLRDTQPKLMGKKSSQGTKLYSNLQTMLQTEAEKTLFCLGLAVTRGYSVCCREVSRQNRKREGTMPASSTRISQHSGITKVMDSTFLSWNLTLFWESQYRTGLQLRTDGKHG